jgi:hypothetical protein
MNRNSEYKLILKQAKKYYKIVDKYSGDKKIIENGQECILLSIEEGNQSDFTELAILLVESFDDIEFYYMVGKYYLQNNGINHMQISFESEIGGGDTTATRLTRIVDDERRTCLCIVDSDKKYYGAKKEGETSKKVKNVLSSRKMINYETYILPMQEIENMIPVEILDKVCKDIPTANDGIRFLKFLVSEDNSKDSPVYYFDYKKGIAKECFVLKKDFTTDDEKRYRRFEEYRTYWGKFLDKYGVELDENEDKPIISGVCEKILNHTIRYLRNEWEQDHIIDVINNSYIKEAWLQVGEKIVTWGCVGNRIVG